MQILVVEDSPVYRKLLSSHLQEWGFPFTIAKDGSEAWTLLQRPDCPKLVLLDWVLPDIDGVELCRRVRLTGSRNSYSYIILLTGKDGKKDMLEAMQAGADDYLVKPFDQLELKARLLVGKRIVGLHEELVSAESNIRRMNENLELEVQRRTASLVAETAERQEAEEAKNRSDRLFRSIAEDSADLIAVVDKTGHRMYNNPSYQRLLGYTPEELKQTISFAQIHPDDRPLVTRAAQKALKTGVGQLVEYRMQRKDGTYVNLESHSSFIRDSHGEIEAMVISARDVSARRITEQNEKLSAIGQLAAGIAHEINTPVQYVSDNIAFLRDTWNQLDAAMASCVIPAHASIACDSHPSETVPPAGPREDWDWVRQEVPKAISQSFEGIRRIRKIVGAMRRFSHTGGGERERVDINEALDATLTVVQNQIKHIADVQTDYQPNLPRVECYPDEMNQTFLNLIVNAAHAIREASTKQARERGKLTIRTQQIDSDVQIEIQDNGTGIPVAVRTRVFEPFFTTKQVGEGTGQGLAICHDIVVQRHHGKIWFDTELDKGTKFSVRIPIQFNSDTGDPQ